MPIELLKELNKQQREAVTHSGSHALVLAGAGCGKTKTMISRAAYLISQGVDPRRIQILTFTKRSASEIVSRVENYMGEESKGLRASTFHTWCLSIIKKSGNVFGVKDFTIIDRDDQQQLFKLYRHGKEAKENGAVLPKPAVLCDFYSFSRNTRTDIYQVLEDKIPESICVHDMIVGLMERYENLKSARKYLDFDDILDIVARGMNEHHDIKEIIGKQYDYILVDEMQDTNPLQWDLLEPLTEYVELFCVGDDAQSIYGFRGADFENVHSFANRISNSTILRLEDNYRSTQGILDLSNWLLSQSHIQYDKKLNAVRGNGVVPQLANFENEWEESKWISEDLI